MPELATDTVLVYWGDSGRSREDKIPHFLLSGFDATLRGVLCFVILDVASFDAFHFSIVVRRTIKSKTIGKWR